MEMSTGKIIMGSKIKFIKDVDEAASGDHPYILWAKKGNSGSITGYCKSGYVAIVDGRKEYPFVVQETEFKTI